MTAEGRQHSPAAASGTRTCTPYGIDPGHDQGVLHETEQSSETRGELFLASHYPPDRNSASVRRKTPRAALALAPNFTTTIQRPTLLGWALSFLRDPHQAGLSAILRV